MHLHYLRPNIVVCLNKDNSGIKYPIKLNRLNDNRSKFNWNFLHFFFSFFFSSFFSFFLFFCFFGRIASNKGKNNCFEPKRQAFCFCLRKWYVGSDWIKTTSHFKVVALLRIKRHVIFFLNVVFFLIKKPTCRLLWNEKKVIFQFVALLDMKMTCHLESSSTSGPR